jgi:hypothetical protein
MPLVQGAPHDEEPSPAGKIRNTHHLLFTAALIMSLFLLSTALITTLLIPSDAFRASGANGEPAGPASQREGRSLIWPTNFSVTGLGRSMIFRPSPYSGSPEPRPWQGF